MDPVQQLFRKTFGLPPVCIVRAPGRLELLGNHTDHNEGLVLAAAIDRSVSLAASPRSDGKVHVVSSIYPGVPEVFSVSHLTVGREGKPHWIDYLKGVLDGLRRHGVVLRGWNAAIHSTVPPGAGLSSSAALEVATALAFRCLHPYTLTPTGSTVPPARDSQGRVAPPTLREKLEIARLCQSAENDFVGLQCGILDPITCLFGKAFQAVEIDCQSLTVEPVPFMGDVALVVCPSGVEHALVAGEYNALRSHCQEAARALRVRSLRAVEPRDVAAHRATLPPRAYECAAHVAGENRRVMFGARALRDDDFEQFGQYMFQSHESSRDLLRNSCSELDLLVELARQQAGCLGARLTGGGFGGATVNLVRRDRVEAFRAGMIRQYEERTGRRITPMICRPDDGAGQAP